MNSNVTSLTRVLIVLGGTLNFGGTENFLMNYYRHMDKNIIQYDFVCQGNSKGVYDDEILSLGGKLYYLPYKSQHPIQYSKQLKNIIVSGNYKVVHAQMDAMNTWPLNIAKNASVPYRISHSHNMGAQTNNPIKRFINLLSMKHISSVATDLWACSKGAGEWLYGKNNNRVVIIKNAIDIERFAFNLAHRNKIRQQYKITDEFVIGHSGRLSHQKNHKFLLQIFNEILKINSKSRLLLVGDGELREELINLANDLAIQEKIIFAGNKKNVNEYYSAMDVFVLPSFFEGLSVSLLEAQCNGLHCICSDILSEESNVTGIDKLNLKLPPERWAQVIMQYQGTERIDGISKLREHGFDIAKEVKVLQDYYTRKAVNV